MILVTGGRGFIGAHTVRALLDLGERCVLGQRAAGPPPALVSEREVRDGRAVVEPMDCTDPGSVLAVGRRHRVTGIVHLAAAGMGASAPLDELSANTAGLFTVLRAAREWGVGRVVVASTIGVYAGVAGPALREDTPLPVASPHPIPAAKKIAEVVADVAASSGLDVVAARIGAIWGPLGRPSSPFFAAPRLVHAAARHAAADGGASVSAVSPAAPGEGGTPGEAAPSYAGTRSTCATRATAGGRSRSCRRPRRYATAPTTSAAGGPSPTRRSPPPSAGPCRGRHPYCFLGAPRERPPWTPVSTSPGCTRTPATPPATTSTGPWPTTSAGCGQATPADRHARGIMPGMYGERASRVPDAMLWWSTSPGSGAPSGACCRTGAWT
ncbi:NAD(P)-dependent oxidoreductase [Microbispora sp. GKU 823]|uniref:NAD-dependent epimerase/dehydratase family protein n=1 Tax=Microbispora sp. GKU 823 TaxID=1652100 RepID=UPI001C4E224F|nr:NAD(P)-dependent oxidoreductase [Microbispora sp. GKU 823]